MFEKIINILLHSDSISISEEEEQQQATKDSITNSIPPYSTVYQQKDTFKSIHTIYIYTHTQTYTKEKKWYLCSRKYPPYLKQVWGF